MRNSRLLILILTLFSSTIYSQEVENKFIFKKEIKPSKKIPFHCIELDSLVLYKNKSYSRIYSYQCHELKYSEQTGIWFIKNGILNLIAFGNKTNRKETKWSDVSFKYEYQVRKNKLIFINRDNSQPEISDYYKRRILKRIKKR